MVQSSIDPLVLYNYIKNIWFSDRFFLVFKFVELKEETKCYKNINIDAPVQNPCHQLQL